MAQIPSLALLRLLLTHTWPPPSLSPPRSVRSVGKVAAVTRVTHNAQNNKGERPMREKKKKNPKNLEFFLFLPLPLSVLSSLVLTVREGLPEEGAQVVSGEAAVGTVPLEALEPVNDLILVEVCLEGGNSFRERAKSMKNCTTSVPSRCSTSCRAA